MTTDFALQLLTPWMLGCGLSTLAERLLKPSPIPLWRRSPAAITAHLAIWTIVFGLLLTTTLRPWFAATVSTALQLFLIAVNNVKYSSLREPFLVQDFEYFWDMLKHPRLYIPFFGWWRTVIASTGGALVIAGGLILEPSLPDKGIPLLTALSGAFITLCIGLATLFVLIQCTAPLQRFKPDKDFQTMGHLGCFWQYGRALFSQPLTTPSPAYFIQPCTQPPHASLPNLVLVQSESFFDPRRLNYPIRHDILRNFDRIRGESLCHGRLSVPAWGANTVRTECAVLTGLDNEALGIHAFNPYRALSKASVPNLAQYFRSFGYRSLCIHPYPASFYLRDRVFPKLGFDEFLDITAFSESDREGQYIGDAAVARKVTELLSDSDDHPTFIFVITMENHGPLHLEREDPTITATLCNTPLPEGCDDLAIYLSHLRNADHMISDLAETLSTHSREGILGWYGDHLPIMPAVYQSLGEPEGRTDYLVWSTEGVKKAGGQELDLQADQLPQVLIAQWLKALESHPSGRR